MPGEDENSPQRQYPPVYERVVPIALGLIVFAIVVLLLMVFGVALGLFSGS